MTAIFDRALLDQNKKIPLFDDKFEKTRTKYIDALKKSDLPTSRREDWKYFSIGHLKNKSYELPKLKIYNKENLNNSLSNSSNNKIIFVDGFYSEELSSTEGLDEISIYSLKEAISLGKLQLDKILEKFSLAKTERFLDLINFSFLENGLYIESQNKESLQTIDLVFTKDPKNTSNNTASFPSVFVNCTKSSQLGIFEVHEESQNQNEGLSSPSCYFYLEENAQLKYYKVQKESSSTTHLSSSYFYLEKDANLDCLHLNTGAKISRNEVHAFLDGENAEIQLNGIYLVPPKNKMDNTTYITHNKPNTRSNQIYKGIIFDQGEGSFSGQIKVQKGTHAISANQLNKNLLLGDSSIAHTRPQLFIDADDVKCSHGATVGRLKDEELFYLTSRAIDQSLARKMLAQAFARDVLFQVTDSSAKERLEEYLKDFWSKN